MSTRTRKGTATAELAVLLPLLVFLFLITVDFARIFYYSLTVENCARNGAVYASQIYNSQQWQGDSALIASTQDASVADATSLRPSLGAGNVTVANETDEDSNPVVAVTVNYTFKPLINYPGIPSQVDIVRTARMRLAPATPP